MRRSVDAFRALSALRLISMPNRDATTLMMLELRDTLNLSGSASGASLLTGS